MVDNMSVICCTSFIYFWTPSTVSSFTTPITLEVKAASRAEHISRQISIRKVLSGDKMGTGPVHKFHPLKSEYWVALSDLSFAATSAHRHQTRGFIWRDSASVLCSPLIKDIMMKCDIPHKKEAFFKRSALKCGWKKSQSIQEIRAYSFLSTLKPRKNKMIYIIVSDEYLLLT